MGCLVLMADRNLLIAQDELAARLGNALDPDRSVHILANHVTKRHNAVFLSYATGGSGCGSQIELKLTMRDIGSGRPKADEHEQICSLEQKPNWKNIETVESP